MKILIVMDPGIPIPVVGYGGIERIIEMLALEYKKMGHNVHLLITTGSTVEGCTMHPFGKAGFPPKKKDAQKAVFTAWAFLWKHRNDYDLIHSFGRLIYLLPILNHKVKKIMSYQREITQRNIKWITSLPHKNLFFTGCSQDLIDRAEVPGTWKAVYNACDFTKYDLNAEVSADAPLIFLGRIERVKGCHTAISIAKATNSQLIIAGNISPLEDEKLYYKTEVEPLIDGTQIKYIGALNDAEKNEWLGKSKAMIFPIEWNEPFGIVMVEAMACGTPVIGFNRGSVQEVIDEGITGSKVTSDEEMIAAIENIASIDRTDCRNTARQRFDISIIAKEYVSFAASYQAGN